MNTIASMVSVYVDLEQPRNVLKMELTRVILVLHGGDIVRARQLYHKIRCVQLTNGRMTRDWSVIDWVVFIGWFSSWSAETFYRTVHSDVDRILLAMETYNSEELQCAINQPRLASFFDREV